MKTIKSFLAMAVLAALSLNVNAQTSTEEYNYLTKGYKIQIESGLDTKSGYTFSDLGTYKSTNRSCEFKALVKQATKKSVGTLCIFYAANGDKYYFCIPAAGSSEELFAQYRSSLSIIDNGDAARDYSFFLSLLWSNRK